MDIIYLIKDYIQSESLQQFVNKRFKDPNFIYMDKKVFDKEYFSHITTSDGVKYALDKDIISVVQVKDDYIFNDIKSTDTVLDVGANIGAFCIPAAKKAKRVFAVEPITTGKLAGNIRLNDSDVIVIHGGLGNGEFQEVAWDEKKRIKTYTLKELISQCGGHVDFLKCDCEGYEWYIDPKDLSGIRRIEMELHFFNDAVHPKQNPSLIKFITENYETTINDGDEPFVKILHAKRGVNNE